MDNGELLEVEKFEMGVTSYEWSGVSYQLWASSLKNIKGIQI
jgi:hypothetical protein